MSPERSAVLYMIRGWANKFLLVTALVPVFKNENVFAFTERGLLLVVKLTLCLSLNPGGLC